MERLDRLWLVADRAREGKLPREDVAFVRDELPVALGDWSRSLPKRFRHPAGFTVSVRSHFHLGYPKGTYCCVQCTLAVYPVLEADAIRYFDCASLAKNVERIIRGRQWRFKAPANAAMLRWSLGSA